MRIPPPQLCQGDLREIGDDEIEMPGSGAAISRRYRHDKPGAFEHPPRDEPCLGVAVDDQDRCHSCDEGQRGGLVASHMAEGPARPGPDPIRAPQRAPPPWPWPKRRRLDL